MRKFFLMIVLFFYAVPVCAQEGSFIRVIDDDGKVQEFEMNARPVAPDVPAPEPVPAPTTTSDPEPVPVPPKTVVEPKPEVVKAAPEKETSAPKAAAMVYPARKPVVPQRKASGALDVPEQSGPISREDAISIALDIAPPARNVVSLPRVYNGKPVYLVRFSTEGGVYEVIVDMASGDVLK